MNQVAEPPAGPFSGPPVGPPAGAGFPREPILVFDIETVPDAAGARRLQAYPAETSEADAIRAMQAVRRAKKGTDFQPPHLQRIVAISGVLRCGPDTLRCASFGDRRAGEAEILAGFFEQIHRYRPVLVSWNGAGFDLPVIHYRSLLHGVACQVYWDTTGREAKWDNYLSRYHERHTDLMDLLALYNSRNAVGLSELAQLLGFPGKLGMDGSKVAGAWLEGGISGIRAYCETDVMNTWLVYLRFCLIRGQLTPERHADELALVKSFLAQQGHRAHWREFAAAWEHPDPT